jgi:hypothetical protein
MTNDPLQGKAIINALRLVHLLYTPPRSRIEVLEKLRMYEIPLTPGPHWR